MRTVEIYYEPIFCALIGALLVILGQVAGAIIVLSAIAYFIVNLIAAIHGDHFIMDKIDEIICNQELSSTFVQGNDISPRGVPFYAKKPSSAKLREEFAETVLTPEDEDAAIVN